MTGLLDILITFFFLFQNKTLKDIYQYAGIIYLNTQMAPFQALPSVQWDSGAAAYNILKYFKPTKMTEAQ